MSHTKVQETLLPGVGVRHDFVTEDDTRIGVLNHHSGRMDLLIYDDFDPDSCSEVVRLTEDEGHVLGELLGASQVVKSINNLQQSIGGLAIDWIKIGQTWPCADQRIDSLRLSETGVLIVAVIRGDDTTPIPTRDFELQPGDTVVVIGRPEGIQRAYHTMHGDA